MTTITKISTIPFALLCETSGTFQPSNVKEMQSIFDFVMAELPPVDADEADALARGIIRLYRHGYRDPAQVRDLLIVENGD